MIPFTEILRFIELIRECFPNAPTICTQGSCVRFALILKHQYPKGEIYYNQDHAIFKYGSRFYDINGITKLTNHIPLKDYSLIQLDKILKLRYDKCKNSFITTNDTANQTV